jgi:hypothetical protein
LSNKKYDRFARDANQLQAKRWKAKHATRKRDIERKKAIHLLLCPQQVKTLTQADIFVDVCSTILFKSCQLQSALIAHNSTCIVHQHTL